jgi:hypothetical protein
MVMAKNIVQAVTDAMASDSDNGSEEFIDWYQGSTDEQKEIIDLTLIQICGWSFGLLMEKSADTED